MIYAENILLCILIPLLVSLLFITGKAKRFALSFSVGMIVCLLAAYISGYTELLSDIDEFEAAVYVSPIIEELMKMLPVLFCLVVLRTEGSDLLLVAAGIGSGFATFENCCYLLTRGSGVFSYVMIRGLAVGIMHIVCMMVFALSLIAAKRFHALSFPGVFGCLALSMTYHGLYNLLVSLPGLSSSIGYALPIVTVVYLYYEYRKYSNRN
ncbi:MAG: PrsW family intramembrane metalloprotease [Firmicutes bacterium]|nr:PrsW family intramembrane metalloprotease [Bacillota bacterium]